MSAEPDALATWKQKLNYLQYERALAADTARRFELDHLIQEAEKYIEKLSADPTYAPRANSPTRQQTAPRTTEHTQGTPPSERPAAQRDRLIVVLHSGSGAPLKKQSYDHQYKERLLAAFERDLPGRVSRHAPDVSQPDKMPLITSEFLTCQAAVVLVDSESLQSEFMVSKATLLAWRSTLGMPLLTVPLHGLERPDVVRSRLSFLRDYAVAPSTDAKQQNEAALRQTVTLTSKHFTEAFRARPYANYSDPATTWADDVTRILSDISDTSIPKLGVYLNIPPDLLAQAPDPRRILAAALFDPDLTDAYRFLQHAVPEMNECRGHRGKSQSLVDRILPTWVDLSAGRLIVSAAHLPPVRRLCGLRLSQLEWAEHAVKRATANSPEYPSVRLSSVIGERIEELVLRHDATLRKCLCFNEDDPPEFIAETLRQKEHHVFAVLDSKNLSQRQLAPLLRRLRERFPGITFVLVSDRQHAMWKFRPPIQVAIDHLDPAEQRRVAHFVQASRSLVEI